MIGKIAVSPLPNPLSIAVNNSLVTNLPSGEVSNPVLIELNGTCDPAREWPLYPRFPDIY